MTILFIDVLPEKENLFNVYEIGLFGQGKIVCQYRLVSS